MSGGSLFPLLQLYYSNCFFVTCLAKLLFCLLGEIFRLSVSGTAERSQEGKQESLTLSGENV